MTNFSFFSQGPIVKRNREKKKQFWFKNGTQKHDVLTNATF